MKWIKKASVLLMSLVMTVLLLAGCQNGNGSTVSSQAGQSSAISSDTTPSSDAMPSSDAPVELKKVTVQVEQDGKVTLEKTYESGLETLEELLLEKAEELGATLTDSEYGKFVEGMNGYVADASKNEYFEFLADGVSSPVGIKETKLADGASYLFRLSTF